MSTGILVIYADAESFTFMTPEGHALSAWITFSAYRDADETVVQVQALERTSDPFIELSYMFGANRANDKFWERTLENLARSLGVGAPVVESTQGLRRQAAAVEVRAQRAAQRRGQHGRGHRHRTGALGPAATAGRVTLDAIVVGGGPNGLAAAIELARAGRSVRLYEAADEVGGGSRSAELTLPGFVHDPCSSVHPLSLGSPFLSSLDLGRHGLAWVQPDAPVAHALSPGRSIVLPRALDDPALDEALGSDAARWRALLGPAGARVGPAGAGRARADRPATAPSAAHGPVRAAEPAVGDARSPGSRSGARRRGRCSRGSRRTRCSA